MSYADMPAGPELDRLVAEKVMGWKPTHYDGYTRYSPSGRIIQEVAMNNEWWSPSTEIAHAWEVVELLQQNGFGFALTGDDRGHISCEFWKHDDDRAGADNWHARGATMPECICHCALKAME